MKTTYTNLIEAIVKGEMTLARMRNDLARLPGIEFIKATVVQLDRRPFVDAATILAEEMTNRDEPMSREDVKQVFEASGWEYCDRHIDEAHPDSQETINEQIAYYRE